MTTFEERTRKVKSAMMHPPRKIAKVTIAAEISGRVCSEIRWCSGNEDNCKRSSEDYHIHNRPEYNESNEDKNDKENEGKKVGIELFHE